MPTDRELFVLRHTDFGHIRSDAQAAEHLADIYRLSIDSVRGRLSRANTPENNLEVAERTAKNPPTKSPSILRQEAVFRNSRRSLSQSMSGARRKTLVGLFDVHYPHTRFDSLNLALQIIADISPDYLVYGGDFDDNEGFSNWDDDRSPYDRLFSADYQNNRIGSMSIRAAVRKAARGALELELTGNHCMWRYNYLRRQDPQQAEERIADYVEELERQGVHVFSTTREVEVRVHHKLTLWHGQFTSPNHQQNAKSTLAQFMEDGEATSVVVGHTHRPIHIPGSSVGYSGVDYWNAPCLSRVDKIPWLKRDPKAWDIGLFFAEMDFGGVEGENIIFKPKGRALTAQFKGRRYETELKE
jgi:nucleotide-binding universal stress UspA family protein